MSSLFELTGKWLDLDHYLSNFDGDITDEDKEREVDRIFEEMAATDDAIEDKIDGYIYVMAEMSGRAEQREKEAARLSELVARDRTNAEKLKQRLKDFLKLTGREKLETKLHRLSVAKNGGVAPLLIDDGVDVEKIEPSLRKLIPERYEFDKDAIRKHLKEEAGELTWARLGERGDHLNIK